MDYGLRYANIGVQHKNSGENSVIIKREHFVKIKKKRCSRLRRRKKSNDPKQQISISDASDKQ